MRFINTFATWCPCSDVHKLAVLLYGIIYQGKPVVEAGKCLELVESSIKTMGFLGLEWFKLNCQAYSTLKKMRNVSAHATMVREPDYNKVIELLTAVLKFYHEHYFVSAAWICRPFLERICHDPNCPKRGDCLKRQQEYLRPSASCVAFCDQIIYDEENRRKRMAEELPSYCVRNDDYDGYDFCRDDGKSLHEVCREAGDESRQKIQPGRCYAHSGKQNDFCEGCRSPDGCPDCSGPDGDDFVNRDDWMFKFGRKRWELLYGWRSDIPQEEDPDNFDKRVKEYDEQQRNEKLAESLKAAHLLYDQGTLMGMSERLVVEDHLVELLERIEACTCKKDMSELVEPRDLILKAEVIMRRRNSVKHSLTSAWNEKLGSLGVQCFKLPTTVY